MMNSSLLEEAIVDAQQLRELAEQTAKNKIVEAVMPQIREMINKRILGESLEEIQETEDSDSNESSNIDEEYQKESVDESLAEALAKLVSERQRAREEAEENHNTESSEIKEIEESIYSLRVALSEGFHKNKSHSKKIANKIVECTNSALDLRYHLTLNQNSTNKSLGLRLENSIKELKDMARNNRNIFDFLFEENSGHRLNEATLTIDFDDEDKEALGDSYEELERILAAAGIQTSGGGQEEDEGDDLADLEDEDTDEDAEGDDDLDLGDMEEEEEEEDSEMKEYGYGMRRETSREMEGMRDKNQTDENLENEVVESLMRRLSRGTRGGRSIREGSASEMAGHYGGAEVLGDVILDLDEEDLINVLADELGKYDGVKEPRMRAESRRPRLDRHQARLQESAAQARAEANRYRKTASDLQKQLTEMNLFNAKLLYANKLMQNKDLSMKQQRAIVEALDNAKTIREAKLLFESLTDSLNRKPQTTRNLSEGMVRPVGAASKPTRSAAPASTSGVDSDRWALLAGINK